ncbi:helix-turn-helix transcriptional regulator [Rhodopseudomonas sp. HC1]|uniref:helix-turn-helix transcriptional regulator n=1 Tax=Rhodopseudomonas infernalis TaxID=2897386 RepID=UPI001EE97468|nr:helix-turn-helix transcriptional regulator [Rhodopseudomonas infernalis]MCG6206335.1 helix-turn-helix transcriptional regulator [Rhodopseudomonas infernalis]
MPVMTKSPSGEDIVILARKEYDRLVAAASQDTADTAAARSALARIKTGEERTLTSAEVDALLASKSPLSFYRKRAGWTQAALAKSVGIAQGFLSEIEAGRKTGDVKTLRKIADTLDLQLDDLVSPKDCIPIGQSKRKTSR